MNAAFCAFLSLSYECLGRNGYEIITHTGGIYMSSNYGSTWAKTSAPSFGIKHSNLSYWFDISTSSTGQYTYALMYPGKIDALMIVDGMWRSFRSREYADSVNCECSFLCFSFSF